MSASLGNLLLPVECENENLFVIPTKFTDGGYSVMLTYASQRFEENIPEYTEELSFEESLAGKKLEIYCIDKETTNPYRLAERLGVRFPNDEEAKLLREEGRLKPIFDGEYDGKPIRLRLTANSTYLVKVI